MDDLVKSVKALLTQTTTNNTVTTANTSIDATNGVTKVEERYSLKWVSAATLSIISSAAGYFRAVIVGSISNPTLTVYDNASGASGSVLALVEPGTRGSYVVNVPVTNGISVYTQVGNAPSAFISYR